MLKLNDEEILKQAFKILKSQILFEGRLMYGWQSYYSGGGHYVCIGCLDEKDFNIIEQAKEIINKEN